MVMNADDGLAIRHRLVPHVVSDVVQITVRVADAP
jgi:hypothetical protein